MDPRSDSNWDLHGKRPPCFGLMLPSGIDLSDSRNAFEGIQKRFHGRIDKVEQAYRLKLVAENNDERNAELVLALTTPMRIIVKSCSRVILCFHTSHYTI